MQCEIQLYILVTMAILSHCFVKKSQIFAKSDYALNQAGFQHMSMKTP